MIHYPATLAKPRRLLLVTLLHRVGPLTEHLFPILQLALQNPSVPPHPFLRVSVGLLEEQSSLRFQPLRRVPPMMTNQHPYQVQQVTFSSCLLELQVQIKHVQQLNLHCLATYLIGMLLKNGSNTLAGRTGMYLAEGSSNDVWRTISWP